MKNPIRKMLVLSAAFIGFIFSGLLFNLVHADYLNATVGTAGTASGVANSSLIARVCVTLPGNLYFGSRQAGNGEGVSVLQEYLGIHPATGYFGPVTLRLVIAFQRANGLPGTGFVGQLTRAKIRELTCGGNPNPNLVPNPAAAPLVVSLSPMTGSVGTQVTMTGSGFDSNSYVLLNENVAAHVSSLDGTHLSFSIPSAMGPQCNLFGGQMMACPQYAVQVTPGLYSLTVKTARGESNPMSINIASAGSQTDSGVSGTVTIGPSCPVVSFPPTSQCADKPYSAVITITPQDSSVGFFQTTVTSDGNGMFSIAVPPGTYTFSHDSASQYPRLYPQSVVVTAHQYALVHLMFDSGIR